VDQFSTPILDQFYMPIDNSEALNNPKIQRRSSSMGSGFKKMTTFWQ
jgi:hypothetical protein